MRELVAAAAALLLATSGCTAVVDGVYLLGNGRYTTSTTESRPLPQTIDLVEYEAAVEPDGSMRVACFARTRQVQRTWEVTKTYRHRGGFDKPAYLGTALLDGIFGAVTAGLLLSSCTDEDSDLSCWNTLYATPFAVAIAYAGIRYATVKSPILIDKTSSEGSLAFGGEPISEQATACESLASLWLGSATGPDDLQVLSGHAENAGTRSLAEGALEIALNPTGAIALTPEVAERWALEPSLHLFAVDQDGIPHRLAADRCALLRPLSPSLSADAQAAYVKDCAPSSNATAPTADGNP